MSTENSSESCEIMLFGVRVIVGPMRKSLSLNDLSDYVDVPTKESHSGVNVPVSASGYLSADNASDPQKGSTGSRKRKLGVPWTEEEHKRFLVGLHKLGKGDWRRISRIFVKSRTPTQVASHAQKYFLRQSNNDSRRRRSSLFDITTESATSVEKKIRQENKAQPLLPPAEIVHAVPDLPVPTQQRAVDFNLNQEPSKDISPLSLDLSLSFDQVQDSNSQDIQLIDKCRMRLLSD